MNTYKAILDTRRPNGVIATITQFDNATLALQIVTNGEIDQPWEAPHFELIAMKRDQQAVRESDQAAFTINDAGEHRVTVDLKEQFLTCRGSVKMQLVVKDGDRLSTSIFYVMVGESLDHDIIESHRDVAVLDELETYVKQGFDDLAYQEQRMKDVEKMTHELNELMVGNEAERQAAEANRQALFEGNESQRQNTFNQQLTSQRREFDTSQADREGVFNALKQNLSSEFNAAQNEREREFDRVMVSNQTQFNDAERSRATAFSNRQIENEHTFTANENARQTLFNANEAGRQTNEADRVSNENTRKTNEAERVTAEANRQQKMSEFETKATQLSDELDAQVARVDAFVSANEEKLLGDRDKVDYMGNTHESVKAASDANVDWLLGEVNTAHYEGQHITATETIEGHAKSAILKGQTLVNIYDIKTSTSIGKVEIEGGICTLKGVSTWVVLNNKLPMIKTNTTYTLIVNIIANTLEYSGTNNDYALLLEGVSGNTAFSKGYEIPKGSVGTFKTTLTTKSQFTDNPDHLSDIRISPTAIGGSIKFTYMIIEGDYTNYDIPYFEGMQSVKMPVLTTTGKNLFPTSTTLKNNAELADDGELKYGGGLGTEEYIPLTFFEQCVFSSKAAWLRIAFYDIDKKFISINYAGNNKKLIFTPPINAKFFRVSSGSGGGAYNPDELQYQIEKGTQATPYEPFKSNILTVNEPVELRGIGDVQDELDGLTGEATECVGEMVLNGSEVWSVATEGDTVNGFSVYTSIYNRKNGSNGICDKLPVYRYSSEVTNKTNFILFVTGQTKVIVVNIKGKSSKDEVVEYLKNNPITIQYQLAEKSNKTVDLSDNHVYSYKDVTHYDCSSAEGSLVPTLSIDVPTNLPAVVTRQRATIQELEKENVALKNEIEETANSSVNGDLELMSSQFELDFRLFEIEMNLDMPMMATMRGVKSMAMTVYQQAKTLILAGKYEREDMEYKLTRYKAAGRITVEEYDELIALMDARELVD